MIYNISATARWHGRRHQPPRFHDDIIHHFEAVSLQISRGSVPRAFDIAARAMDNIAQRRRAMTARAATPAFYLLLACIKLLYHDDASLDVQSL